MRRRKLPSDSIWIQFAQKLHSSIDCDRSVISTAKNVNKPFAYNSKSLTCVSSACLSGGWHNIERLSECSKFCLVENLFTKTTTATTTTSINCMVLFTSVFSQHAYSADVVNTVHAPVCVCVCIFANYASSFSFTKISHIWTYSYVFLSFFLLNEYRKD